METIKLQSDLCEPDPRQRSFVARDRSTGEVRKRSVADIYESVAGAQITADVPEQVRSAFATAQNLMVYSWYVYAFGVIADLQAYAALELALRDEARPGGQTASPNLAPANAGGDPQGTHSG